jgi:hypothetical protein
VSYRAGCCAALNYGTVPGKILGIKGFIPAKPGKKLFPTYPSTNKILHTGKTY